MSHFAVLVVLPEAPTDEAIGRVLAPWHEFECTGRNDEYVVEVDISDEADEDYNRWTTTLLRDAEGVLHDPFDDQGDLKPQFTKDKDRGLGLLHVPEGFEEVEVPVNQFEDRAKWIANFFGLSVAHTESKIDLDGDHKFGYVLVDSDGNVIRTVKRTNPNKKWDYWTVGGRYSGRLAGGYNPDEDPANQEPCFCAAEVDPNCRVCHGTGMRTKYPSKWVDVGNRARWGDLDLEALKRSRVASRKAMVDELVADSGLSFDEFEIGYKAKTEARDLWLTLDEPRPRGQEYHQWLMSQPNGELATAVHSADPWGDIETARGQSIAGWIQSAPPLSAYAVVIDGKWCAQGEMGWFGVSHGDAEDWPTQLAGILNTIPEDHYVAFVDCHI
jgi:hypothetical protein